MADDPADLLAAACGGDRPALARLLSGTGIAWRMTEPGQQRLVRQYNDEPRRRKVTDAHA